MKYAIALLIALFSINVHANYFYIDPGHAFPDELSTEGLPEVIPCKSGLAGDRQSTMFKCTWLSVSRMIEDWDDRRMQAYQYTNHPVGKCRDGRCFVNNRQVGGIPFDGYLTLSLHYYVWMSTDEQPVAHLMGTGPGFGGEQVSYVHAARVLKDFYIRSGMTEREIAAELDNRVEGGAALLNEVEAPAPVVNGPVVEVWCNPRMDDDCYVNGQSVPKADLGNYLPSLDPEDVEADGGVCEFPICYDSNYKPIGIRK